MARPSSLTPDLSRQLARFVSQGNYLETAARLAGVGPRTVRTWLAKGKAEAEGPHHEFRQAIQKAEATAETRNLAT